jgi:hypothetical protein
VLLLGQQVRAITVLARGRRLEETMASTKNFERFSYNANELTSRSRCRILLHLIAAALPLPYLTLRR